MRDRPSNSALSIAYFGYSDDPGTPASELTDEQRFHIAVAAGAPTEVVMIPAGYVKRLAAPISITDRGDGGYFVAGKAPQHPGAGT